MAAAGITLNQRGLRQILNSRQVRADLTRRGRSVLAQAITDAPVDTGAYRDSLSIEQATTDRAVVRVVADVDHAVLVEATTGTLNRALDAAARR